MVNHRKEIMSPEFTKHHLDVHTEKGNVHFLLHQFTGPDKGGPHDHPYDFTTYILKGGYKERIYDLQPDGTYETLEIFREPGTSFEVTAFTIHELIELPEGVCWTIVTPGPKVREPGFWRFEGDNIFFRPWNGHWTQIKIDTER